MQEFYYPFIFLMVVGVISWFSETLAIVIVVVYCICLVAESLGWFD